VNSLVLVWSISDQVADVGIRSGERP